MDWLTRHAVLGPVLIPLMGAAIALLVRQWRVARAIVGVGACTLSAATCVWLLREVAIHGGQPIVLQLGGWAAPYGISFVADYLSATFALLAAVVVLGAAVYSTTCHDKVMGYTTYWPLLLTLATSLSGAFLTGDTFNLFVFAELLVISAAVLTAISDDRGGVEAALKYFYIATLAGVLLIAGNGLLYAAYGTLNMADLAVRYAADPGRSLAGVAAACIAASMLVKAAAAGFHWWQPDFHSASPTPVSAVLSGVVVKVGLYGLLRMTTLVFEGGPAGDRLRWTMLGLGVAGVMFGGLSALGTRHLKRMLAYSTVAQVGFMLAAASLGSAAGLAAAVVFAVGHGVTKSALLMLAGGMASRSAAGGGAKSAAFEALGGVGRGYGASGVIFLVGGMALAGLPPTVGFLGKLGVLMAWAAGGHWWVMGLLLAGSMVTLVYVARAYVTVWWAPRGDEPVLATPGSSVGHDAPVVATSLGYGERGTARRVDGLWAPAVLVAIGLTLGMYPRPLADLATRTAEYLRDPGRYIAAVHPQKGGG